MASKIYRYLVDDHARLDDALRRATRDPDHIDRAAYAEFREGLLRHFGMEEKILLPPVRSANGGKPLASAAKLHLDHGALAALLVPRRVKRGWFLAMMLGDCDGVALLLCWPEPFRSFGATHASIIQHARRTFLNKEHQ